ncbi:hypothetical protein R3P38DRAFT_2792891 [Favolaschia claudopus]|uniref:Uncharacterized protein n=1 Tax=Favolaschia claudopus TaxID=2862362 RepID=A0AAW0ADT5_9AGAR
MSTSHLPMFLNMIWRSRPASLNRRVSRDLARSSSFSIARRAAAPAFKFNVTCKFPPLELKPTSQLLQASSRSLSADRRPLIRVCKPVDVVKVAAAAPRSGAYSRRYASTSHKRDDCLRVPEQLQVVEVAVAAASRSGANSRLYISPSRERNECSFAVRRATSPPLDPRNLFVILWIAVRRATIYVSRCPGRGKLTRQTFVRRAGCVAVELELIFLSMKVLGSFKYQIHDASTSTYRRSLYGSSSGERTCCRLYATPDIEYTTYRAPASNDLGGCANNVVNTTYLVPVSDDSNGKVLPPFPSLDSDLFESRRVQLPNFKISTLLQKRRNSVRLQ